MITLTGKNGRYNYHEQKGLIQAGGKFNRVYKGYDARYRPVLIKQLLPHLCHDPAAVKRFSNEFYLRCDHPNIIGAHDLFEAEGGYYLVRRWVEGTDLGKVLYRFGIRQTVELITAVLRLAGHLHGSGIMHLDIQPRNILLGDDGAVYLSDLGLAAKEHELNERQPFNICYSSPEQVLNAYHLVDHTSDLYAVGMILLEMLAREKPHRNENPEILMNLVLAAPLEKPSRISDALFAIVKKATARPGFGLPPSRYSQEQLTSLLEEARNSRYTTAGEFITALESLRPEDLQKRPWWIFR